MPRVACTICSKEFYSKPSHQLLGWGKYCSIECRTHSQLKGKVVVCSWCRGDVYRTPKSLARSKSGKYFCSKSCQTFWRNKIHIGPLSAKWKTGESAYRNMLIRSGRPRICALCKIANPLVLAAHHKDHNRENNTVDNLTWLCFNCHYLVHHDANLDRMILDGIE